MEFLANVEAAQSTSDHAWLAVRVNTLLVTAAEAQGGATDAEGGGSSRANPPGARPSREATDAWVKTAKGFELHEALGEETKGDVRIAALAEKLESYQDQSGEALEAFREFLEPRIAEARQELSSKDRMTTMTTTAMMTTTMVTTGKISDQRRPQINGIW